MGSALYRAASFRYCEPTQRLAGIIKNCMGLEGIVWLQSMCFDLQQREAVCLWQGPLHFCTLHQKVAWPVLVQDCHSNLQSVSIWEQHCSCLLSHCWQAPLRRIMRAVGNNEVRLRTTN